MATEDFFRSRLDQMIDLRHPLAVLAGRLPWAHIETVLSPSFERKSRLGKKAEIHDLFGPTLAIGGAGISAAGRPRLPIRLMAALLYLKHAFNLSDEELVQRWSENVVCNTSVGWSITPLISPVMPPRSDGFAQRSEKRA